MKKVFCMVLAFALVMCLFAGCGKDAGTEGGTALKIGTIGPLTGDAAQYGNATKNGAELADRVHIVLMSTDQTKPEMERIVRQANKAGLYNALSFGDIMLQGVLNKKK